MWVEMLAAVDQESGEDGQREEGHGGCTCTVNRSLDTCWRVIKTASSQHAEDVNSAGCVGCGIEDLGHHDLQTEEEGPGHAHRAFSQVI